MKCLGWRRCAADCLRSLALFLVLCVCPVAHAATTQYHYDDLGRLVQAIRSDGSVWQYQYDPNGNVLAINRISSSALSVSGFAPQVGHEGASVTLFGTGFSSMPSSNEVWFGSAQAVVSAATSTSIVVTVPVSAVTGPVTVAVNGNSATSAISYVVRRPAIVSFSPAVVSPGGQVTVVGTNLHLVPSATSVLVAGSPATLVSASNAQVIFKAPTTSGSGAIQISTPYGNAVSASNLIIAPTAIGSANVIATGALLADGVSQAVDISAMNKFGVFTFSATQDQYLSVQISTIQSTPSGGSFSYSIYTPTNGMLSSGNVSSTIKSIHLPKIPASGTYLLIFGSGSRTLQLAARLEVNAILATDSSLLAQATETTGQSRRVAVQATAGQSLGLAITNKIVTPTGGSIAIHVYRPSGSSWENSNCNAANSPGCQFELRNLPTTGTYTIVVATTQAATMGFSLRLTPHLTGTLSLDTPLSLNLATPGQYAWLNFTATAGQTVALGAAPIATAPANRAVWIKVYGPDGLQVGGFGSSTFPMMNLTNLAAGTHSVLVHTVEAETVTMQLTLGSGMAGPIPIDNGAATFASTVKSQNGYFTFAGTAGENLGIAVTGIAMSAGGVSMTFTVYRPNGNSWKTFKCNVTDTPGCQSELRNLPSTGTYSIQADPSEAATMGFSLRLTHHLTGTLSLDTPLSLSVATPGQYAWLNFTATAGQTVALGATPLATTPANNEIRIQVYGPDGLLVGEHGSSTVPIVNLANLAAGTHSVLVYAVDAGTATMQLTVASGMAGQIPIDDGSATFASTLKSQNGYFTFTAAVGENLGIAVTGIAMSVGAGTMGFTVYRPNGNSLKSFTCEATAMPGCQSELRNLPSTGTYTIKVDPSEAATMGFSLRLTHHISDALTTGTPYNLNLAVPGQHAALTFTATAGMNATISGTAISSTPSNRAVWLTVLNPAGDPGANSRSATSPIVNLSNLAAGVYTVIVNTVSAGTATLQINLQ